MVNKLLSHVNHPRWEMLALTIVHLEDVDGHINWDSSLLKSHLLKCLLRDRLNLSG